MPMPACAPTKTAALMAYEIAAALEPSKLAGMVVPTLKTSPIMGVRGWRHLAINKVGLGVHP